MSQSTALCSTFRENPPQLNFQALKTRDKHNGRLPRSTSRDRTNEKGSKSAQPDPKSPTQRESRLKATGRLNEILKDANKDVKIVLQNDDGSQEDAAAEVGL